MSKVESTLPDADMRAVPAALRRAARRAREIARQTGTPLVIRRNGKLVEEQVAADQGSDE
jgi:hypothetical protein